AAAIGHLAALHEVRGSRHRKVDLSALALVVVVEAWDVRLDPVHGCRVEGRGRGGDPHGHRLAGEPPRPEQPPDVAETPAMQGLVENGLGQTIDLDYEKTATARISRHSEAGPARDAIHHSLELQDNVIDQDRKSTRLNSSHVSISYAVFCL